MNTKRVENYIGYGILDFLILFFQELKAPFQTLSLRGRAKAERAIKKTWITQPIFARLN